MMLRGWILYHRSQSELQEDVRDHAVRRLLQAAAALDVDLKVLSPREFELLASGRDSKSILYRGESAQLPHFVLPRMGAGTTYFALAILRQLEHLGVTCINSPSAVEQVKDKLCAIQLLAQSALPTPKTMVVRYPVNVAVVEREIGFPAVIKNVSGTGGRGVSLCDSASHFQDLIDLIYCTNEDTILVVQEFVESSYGRDLRVLVIGGRSVGCIERVSSKGFKSNIAVGGEPRPFQITSEIEWLATEATRLLGLDISGVDLLFREGSGYAICEANSAPDFAGMESVVGERVAEEILEYIKLRLSKQWHSPEQ